MTDNQILIDLDAPLLEPIPVIDFSALHQPRLTPLSEHLSAVSGRIALGEYLARVHDSMARKRISLARHIGVGKGHAMLICGGGPSIADITQIKTIRALAKKGGKIWAVNKTHDFLLSKGLKPWAACLLDPMPWVSRYISKPQADVLYAVASQCHASVFGALKNYAPHVWHAGIDDEEGTGYPTDILQREYAGLDWLVVPGPTTVGLRSILVGYALGFRDFHLFGLDSSMRGERLHAYAKPKPIDAPEGWVSLKTASGTQKFYTNSHMARQALDFEETMERIAEMVKARTMEPLRVTVHGDGLLPELAKCYGWHATQGARHG
jgi:hypothetical protein